MAELRGLGVVQDEMKKAGGTILTICSDTPDESAKVIEHNHLKFPILSDPDCAIIKKYGLLHQGGGPGGKDIAIPAHMLVDRKGHIVWKHIAKHVTDRPDPDDDISAIHSLKAK